MALRVIASEKVYDTRPGDWFLCVIMSDSELDSYTITGADVEGMADTDFVAAGSIVCSPTANYIAFEDGVVTQSQIGGGGGGGGGGVAGVSAFNGRSGNVAPRKGDYNAAKILTSDPTQTVQDVIDNLATLITYDAALSTTSDKAVQNKVVTEAINELRGRVLPTGGTSGQLLAKNSNTNYDAAWISGDNFMKKSEYDPNNNGKVDKAEYADKLQGPTTYSAQLKNTQGDTYVLTEEDKGKRGGIVPLDENRKILPEFLPDSITAGLTYGGIFNATTRVVRLTPAAKSILGVSSDTMTLQNSSTVPEGYPANAELFYITTVADTFAGMNFAVGDWLISLGTEWNQLMNGSAVSSVNGQTGAVELNSDQILQGTTNLYMSVAERQKLQNIEAEATKDVNVVQSAQITTTPGGVRVLRLTNKNGTVTDFEGASVDMEDYLKKDGNASQTFVMYTPGGARQSFTGNEALSLFHKKVVDYLNALETVAFSGSYLDLADKPTKTSQFTNDGSGDNAYPYIDSRVNNLANYYKKTQTYTKDEVDALIDAIEGMKFIQVAVLPTTDIQDDAIYYVPNSGGTGYTRFQHMNGEWLNLGTTDVSMEEYLPKDGDGSQVTVSFTMAGAREALQSDATLADTIGSLARWVNDLKTICFTASWHDLIDGNELATQEDLEDYVLKHYTPADEGKVLVVNEQGDLQLQVMNEGVVRRGTGNMSAIGNDTAENPVNAAAGANATAFGRGTKASGDSQFVTGRYNVEDAAGAYAEITGGGDATTPMNLKTTNWFGEGWYRGKVSVGNTTDNIIVPDQGNDLTPKNYVDGVVDQKIAEANLLKSMVVDDIPEVEDADANILYLIADPTSEDTYFTYKKVLESQDPDVYVMARIGSTQVQSSSTQVAELPTPSVAYNNAVYQYIGSSSQYKFGFFYRCTNQSYYCWLQTATGNKFFTKSATPRQYDRIYSAIGETLVWWVESVSGVTLTDSAGNTYTRLSSDDKSQYEWQAINDKTSDLENNGNGTGNPSDRFITLEETESRYKLTKKSDASSVTTSTKLSNVNTTSHEVQDVSMATIWDFMWKKIYPVGAIYISYSSTSPATLFGGTWTQISGRFLVASGSASYSYVNTSGSSTTGTVNFNATNTGGSPRVQLTTDTMPKHNHGLPYRKCGSTTGTDWRTDPGSVDGYAGSTQTAGGGSYPTGYGAPFNQLPPYLVVYMWRRTA